VQLSADGAGLRSKAARVTATGSVGALDARTPGTSDESVIPGVQATGENQVPLGSVSRLSALPDPVLFSVPQRPAIRLPLARGVSAAASHLATGPSTPNVRRAVPEKRPSPGTTSSTASAARLLTSDTRITLPALPVKVFRMRLIHCQHVTYASRAGLVQIPRAGSSRSTSSASDLAVCNTCDQQIMRVFPTQSTGRARVSHNGLWTSWSDCLMKYETEHESGRSGSAEATETVPWLAARAARTAASGSRLLARGVSTATLFPVGALIVRSRRAAGQCHDLTASDITACGGGE
jgi:hypothetical protein